MLLAAKLSWLLRGFRSDEGRTVWTGEPKDLFDAHLLATEPVPAVSPGSVGASAGLDAQAFQKSLCAIGVEDDIDWRQLDAFLALAGAPPELRDFANWDAFVRKHAGLVSRTPGVMLAELIARVRPLLGEFYSDDVPFQAAIAADPIDEFAYVLYADKLEERGHAGAAFLRLFVQVYFHKQQRSQAELNDLNVKLKESLRAQSKPWLLRVFGTSERYREMIDRILHGTV